MKILQKNIIDPQEFDLINNRKSPRHLYRLNGNDQYAVVLLDRPNRVFSFESRIVTEVLNDLGGGVHDVTLVEFKEPERGDDRVEAFEVRLYTESGIMISISHNDEVRSCDTADYLSYVEETFFLAVSQIWPNQDLFDFLWVSPEVRERIEPFMRSNTGGVFKSIWRDCQKAIHTSDTPPEFPICVQTEFAEMVMTRTPDRTILELAS